MKLTVDTGEMHKSVQMLTQLAEEYAAIYSRLLNTASNMGNAWKAPDNLAYVEQINGFCEELKAMTAHIQQATTAFEQQAKNYEATTETNIIEVKKLVN